MISLDPRFGGTTKTPAWAGALESGAVPTERRLLDAGDVSFVGNGPDGKMLIGVELKTIPDCINSIQSGRLGGEDGQIVRLVKGYDVAWLLVEGVYRPRRSDGLAEVPKGKTWHLLQRGPRPIYWGDVEAALLSLTIQGGARLCRTYSGTDTAKWLTVLYQWWQKPWMAHTTFKGLYRPEMNLLPMIEDEDPQVTTFRRQVACLPMIGWERAACVVKATGFRCMAELVETTEAEWAQIPNVGKVIAKAAYAALHHD